MKDEPTSTLINNFDVLKRMAADNKDIRLGNDFLGAKAVKAGSQVTIGIAGNVLAQIMTGELRCCLILFNKEEFNEIKKKMECEPE
jgi:hypothetical protein